MNDLMYDCITVKTPFGRLMTFLYLLHSTPLISVAEAAVSIHAFNVKGFSFRIAFSRVSNSTLSHGRL